ncbi:MAG: RpiB/LacA/LacB family sugar-phosphate isomerase [Lacisediminihabitans sp.]
MRIVIGAPSNGSALKDAIKVWLEADDRVTEVIDLSTPEITYPAVSFLAAQAILDHRADRGILVCGTGIGTAIAANKVAGMRAATAHDLVTVRGAVENYDAQILCMGQNVIAPIAANALVDLWLDLHHDPAGSYAPKLEEISEYESRQ